MREQDPLTEHANFQVFEWAIRNGHARPGQEITPEVLVEWYRKRLEARP